MKRGFVGTHLSEVPELLPGSHIVLLSRDPLASLEGRRRNLEVRDTLLVLEPGGTRFAFLFRVPCQEPTVAENVLQYGTGGLWIDGCRIPHQTVAGGNLAQNTHLRGVIRGSHGKRIFGYAEQEYKTAPTHQTGRWPTNLVLIHGPECRRIETAWACQDGCPVAELDQQSGDRAAGGSLQVVARAKNDVYDHGVKLRSTTAYFDEGGASRFFPQFAGESELLEWLGRLIGL